MPDACSSNAGVLSQPSTNPAIDIPAGSGTLLAAVCVMASDAFNNAAFSGRPDPLIATPAGWTKIDESRIAGNNYGGDTGIALAIFTRPYAAGTVTFTTTDGIGVRWTAAVCALGGGNAASHVPTAGGVIEAAGPTQQAGAGLSVVTSGIVVPDDDSLLVYIGASPDGNKIGGVGDVDTPPAGMTMGVVAMDTSAALENVAQVQVAWQVLGAAAATGTRTKVYRVATDDNNHDVAALTTLLAFR